MVCFHTEYLHVEYYTATGVLVSQWFDKCSSKQYRDAMLFIVDIIQEHTINYVISDRRLLPQLSPEDNDWTQHHFRDIFCKMPLRRFAIINSFNDQAVEQTRQFLYNPSPPLPFETHLFEDLTSAYDWLVEAKAA
ncbi:hypothetical protein [Pontibacter liquoris]|uniref:hypothetical protein n=1 Tax=Pontibacter liquoris TaxID=2905677 RepID=UPI001FA7F78D|nr:hypothetical protein [Pontibacter liquoris]